ncbi:MAG: EscU/YscU/HrcU family type III secretion system export apparatus switch protein [Bacillota bacterium]|nr:EscU/YscU/HrcU family type III secretion system export apparatus switch protein [Bacillota bacterium]
MSQYRNDVRNAAALKYNPESNDTPVVVASGMGYVARKIVDVANENQIPVYEDDSLASVLSQLSAGSEVPSELFSAVVDLYLYFLNLTVEPAKESSEI